MHALVVWVRLLLLFILFHWQLCWLIDYTCSTKSLIFFDILVTRFLGKHPSQDSASQPHNRPHMPGTCCGLSGAVFAIIGHRHDIEISGFCVLRCFALFNLCKKKKSIYWSWSLALCQCLNNFSPLGPLLAFYAVYLHFKGSKTRGKL